MRGTENDTIANRMVAARVIRKPGVAGRMKPMAATSLRKEEERQSDEL
jgi:hypothetical protein